MDLISAALSDPRKATMSLAQIVTEEIKAFKASEQYREMVRAERYYRNRSAVQEKRVDVANRSNVKLEHPIYKKLVDQKVRYLLSKPWSVDTANENYAKALRELFDDAFRQKIKSLGRGAVKSGVAWLQPYISDTGALCFMRVPAAELVPLWRDSEKTELDAFIRFYDQEVYEGNQKRTISHAEFWFSGGVRWFVTGGQGSSDYAVDKEHGEERSDWTVPHFTIGDKAYNWDVPPLVWLRYNEEELPLLHSIESLIDDYNWQTSVTADVLRDIAKFIYVLKNYGGTDLAEFIRDLRENMAIKVDGDGGVDKLQADLNIDAVMRFLDCERRDLFDFAAAVDTKDPDLGNASGTAIGFRYMDLDSDCADLAVELKAAFQRLKRFIDPYLQATGRGDFSGETFDVAFNMDLPVNETDIINNARTSDGLLSRRTILRNHPWVEDVDEEMEQLDREKSEAMERFGEGMFDHVAVTGGEDGGQVRPVQQNGRVGDA